MLKLPGFAEVHHNKSYCNSNNWAVSRRVRDHHSRFVQNYSVKYLHIKQYNSNEIHLKQRKNIEKSRRLWLACRICSVE